MKEYVISKNDAGQRADKFLQKAVKNLPASLLYKYLRLKRIKCNGKRCDRAQKLCEGDVLQLYLNDEWFETVPTELAFLKAPPEVKIVYEDENLILLDKPVGLLVHEDEEEDADTLIHRLLHYLYDHGAYDPKNEHSFAPALCNRIDRNTSGIVIAAKNAETLRIMNQKIKDRELKKRYLCAVFGTPEKKKDTLKAFLIKDEQENRVKIYSSPRPQAKTILTAYETLYTNGRYSLLKVDLLTGRTHQIRAHMAYIGHPLVGDTKYGTQKENRDLPLKFQALCSYQLEFCFTTDAGILSYLNHRIFKVTPPEFVRQLFGERMYDRLD